MLELDLRPINYYSELNVSGIEENSIVDGPGIRYAIFTQGCRHKCPGCHNPQTHSLYVYNYIKISKIIKSINKDKMITGVTFSGGEPMLHHTKLKLIAKAAKKRGLSVWCYTGYTFEQLQVRWDWDKIKKFFKYVDVLIDGKFDITKRDISLMWRGSSNQRLIDVQKSLLKNEVVLYEESEL